MALLASDLRQQIIAEARSYIGVPFHHRGRTRKGMDCAGLIVVVARKFGISGDFIAYGARPNQGSVLAVMQANFEQKPIRDVEDGDLFLMGSPDYFPSHVGFFSTLDGKRSIIHSINLYSKCTETHLDDYWRKMLVAAFQFRCT